VAVEEAFFVVVGVDKLTRNAICAVAYDHRTATGVFDGANHGAVSSRTLRESSVAELNL
jgi:hypothetical protein